MSLDSLKPASYSDIVVEKNRLFYRKTKGGENVGKIYWREGWSGDEKLLFDPTTYQKDVTTTVVSFLPSYDGKEVALALSSGGAEVSHIRILDVNAVKLSFLTASSPTGDNLLDIRQLHHILPVAEHRGQQGSRGGT